MRVCIVSDTHRNVDELHAAALIAGDVDWFLHAGDETADAKWLVDFMHREVIGVAGNWDRESARFPLERIVATDPPLFLTHGHRLGVKDSLEHLAKRARKCGASIAVFGHTHVALSQMVGDILMVNPGSLALPRGGSLGTFALLDIAAKGTGFAYHVRHLTTTGTLVHESNYATIN